jgi:hypothetical protein
MTSPEARLVVPLGNPAFRSIRLQALCSADCPGATIRLRVNGSELPAFPLQPGWHAYDWVLPPAVLVSGVNEVEVVAGRGGHDDRARIAVGEVRALRVP